MLPNTSQHGSWPLGLHSAWAEEACQCSRKNNGGAWGAIWRPTPCMSLLDHSVPVWPELLPHTLPVPTPLFQVEGKTRKQTTPWISGWWPWIWTWTVSGKPEAVPIAPTGLLLTGPQVPTHPACGLPGNIPFKHWSFPHTLFLSSLNPSLRS